MKKLCEKNLNIQTIDKAFLFYGIDEKYKVLAYDCLQEILNNKLIKDAFLSVYEMLFVVNTEEFRTLWRIKDVELLFGKSVNPFITNLMILFGAKIHKENMKKFGFDEQQINYHKKRVNECFVNDLIEKGYKGVSVEQMFWAAYFIKCVVIEVGNLQYEFNPLINKIQIHIPRMPKLDIDQVKESLINSKKEIKRYFKLENKQYICCSWLLSKQITKLLPKKSNIRNFQALFNIQENEPCVRDVLIFVYKIEKCNDYSQLPEKTFLQRKIKKELIKGTIFRKGYGELIW